MPKDDLSLDDILAEIETKRKTGGGKKDADPTEFSIEDILGETYSPAPRKRSPAEEKLAKRRAEAEEKARLKEEQRKKAEAEKAEKERLAAEEKARKAAAEAKRKAEEEEKKRLRAEAEEKKRLAEIEEKKRREELKRKKAEEEAAEEKRFKEEQEQRKAEEAARIAALAEEEQEAARKEAERLRKAEEESEKMFATKSIVFEEAPIELPRIEEENAEEKPVDATPEELELEKELRQNRVDAEAQKRLEREIALEDPDDFLTAFNPYDKGEKAGFTQIIETIPAKQLSGDTQGIAGTDLKDIARANAKIADRPIEDIISGETMIMPDFEPVSHEPAIDLSKTFVLSDGFGDTNEIVKPEEDIMKGGTVEIPGKKKEEPKETTVEIPPRKKSTDPLIASINKTLEQKRLSDIAAQSSRSVTEQLEKVARGDTQTNNGFLIEIERASMPQTGHIPVSDPVVKEQKIKSLASKRKRRITDFVLEDITDDDDFEYSDEDEDDFDITDDEGQIWQDLTETHKSLKLRFVLLLVITVFLCGITFAQEFGASINFDLFGLQIDFLDKKFHTDGFIYLNLITGVIGMVLCGSAITNGLTKLFKGKADCDSMVAVSSALSLLGGVLNLSNTDYIQRSKAYIFITAALVGLLFNTLGKLSMISRARKNFRFISADENRYYADIIEGESEVSAFTKGVVTQLPVLAAMRKTEYLTDFLRKSYCEDKADRISRFLAPASLAAGAILGILAYFIPNGIEGMENNIFWASTVAIGFVCLFAPFSIMFIVNNPLRRATKSLLKGGSTLLGYSTAEEFSETNAIMTDVGAIFPAQNVECTNLKPCHLHNSSADITLDQAIILAASLAIKSGSILSRLFFEMINRNTDLIEEIEDCVYEDNMGVMGWYGTRRVFMGNREHMKHHSIKVPEMSAIAKYCRNGSDAVYLAVDGELSIVFFIRLTANPNIRNCLCELSDRGVSLIVKTTDSLITGGRIADLFDVDPEKIKVLKGNLHEIFAESTKYTSRGSGAITCNGSFAAFGRAIIAAKKLVKDVNLSQSVMLAGIFLAVVLGAIFALSVKTLVFSPAVIIIYNLFWMLPVLLVQSFRRY